LTKEERKRVSSGGGPAFNKKEKITNSLRLNEKVQNHQQEGGSGGLPFGMPREEGAIRKMYFWDREVLFQEKKGEKEANARRGKFGPQPLPERGTEGAVKRGGSSPQTRLWQKRKIGLWRHRDRGSFQEWK